MDTATSADMPQKFLKDVINPWLLGADPEFAILTPPDIVVPNSGLNAVNTIKPAGGIGYDHSGRVWELRPSPSPSAYVVATNLWKLLRQSEMDKVEKFKWKSGALGGKKFAPPAQPNLQSLIQMYTSPLYGMSHEAAQAMAQQVILSQASHESTNPDTLGGHVHFGISNINPSQRQALHAVTTAMLNLDILPQKENTKRLAITAGQHPQYGHMQGGDATRECNGHIEYRCAPSWLDKPGQSLAALTVYKLAAARPSSVKWTNDFALKDGLRTWLDELSAVDVDAWVLARYIESRGFEAIQADPSSDFKPRWRKENLWEK